MQIKYKPKNTQEKKCNILKPNFWGFKVQFFNTPKFILELF